MPTHRDMPQNAPAGSERAAATSSPQTPAPAREAAPKAPGGPLRAVLAVVGLAVIALGGWQVDQHLRPPLSIPAATPPALQRDLGLRQQCPSWATYEVNGFWFCESSPYPRAGTDSPPCLGPGPSDRTEDQEEQRDKRAARRHPPAYESRKVRRHEYQFKPENTRCRPGLASSS